MSKRSKLRRGAGTLRSPLLARGVVWMEISDEAHRAMHGAFSGEGRRFITTAKALANGDWLCPLSPSSFKALQAMRRPDESMSEVIMRAIRDYGLRYRGVDEPGTMGGILLPPRRDG